MPARKRVLHKPLESTSVVIEEMPTENWGW
jgi:phenylpyruvate tautomerase PptA (4-oxalocrotonate tautomerase family)